ncbi:MAG: hypothetical protein GY679_04275 [Mycoplasma sp.]|nr:hypothetical protein [Mycoplasma sp.]
MGQFADMFKNMFRSDRKLNNQASAEQPKPKNRKHRNINQQNKRLPENIFDSYGNCIYCLSCIKKILRVGGDRLSRLRKIKRQQVSTPVIRVRKDQVPAERICDAVLPVNETNISDRRMNLKDSSITELRSPPKLHCGKSNNNKEELLPRFLNFIDNNSQSDGRRIGSHGPLFFLSSKSDRISAPSVSKADKPEQWKKRSPVYGFDRTPDGNKSISDGTAEKWLKTYRPKHAVTSKKTDYCEMCAECREQKRRHETVSMRLQQNGNGNEDEIRENQTLAESYGLLPEEHRTDAGSELRHCRQQTGKCRSLYRHIGELQRKDSETERDKTKLRELTGQVTFTLSSDYRQSELIPHRGFSPQPGETCCLRKLSHNIFGIVSHTLAENTVYVSDERAGAENGDMTISLADHRIYQKLPSRVRHLCLFMNNGATDKNRFMTQRGMELAERGDCDTIRMCFFVPGRAKNDADRFFARISHAFDKNDVFVTEHLATLIRDTIRPAGSCILINNRDIVNRKDLLTKKYSSFRDIKSCRDFLIKRSSHGKAAVYHKSCCHDGEYVKKNLLEEGTDAGSDLKKEVSNFAYDVKGLSSDLSENKISDPVKMYDRLTEPALRPKRLPVSQQIKTSHMTISSPSSESARQHRMELKKKRKTEKKCT